MDANWFDTLTKSVSRPGTRRRQVLRSALGGAAALLGMGVARVPEVAAKKGVHSEGPCGNGTIKDNRCKHHGQCCTGFCDKGKGKKPYGRCRVSTDPAPPLPPICPGSGQTCSATKGTTCCPDIDPNVVCTGGLNPAKTCQDCTQPITAAGAYCQATPGNQCCDGDPDCFVGVRVVDNQPACYRTGVCRPANTPCSSDTDCGGSLQCAKGSLAQCGCAGTTPTFCGTPCS